MTPRQKWTLVFIVIGVGHIFILLFPIAWVVSGFGSWSIKYWLLYPLWLSMDDTRLDKNRPSGLAVDYEVYLDNYRFRWIGVLIWHIRRNTVWNLVELFQPPKQEVRNGNQDIVITKMIHDNLTNGEGTDIVQDGPYAAGAGLKFVGKSGQDPWQVNTGDIISSKHTIIGEGEFEYLIGDWQGWRYTRCRIVSPWWFFGAERWRTTYKGTNANRYSLKWKHQKLKPWGNW